jgi:hypothetical protein
MATAGDLVAYLSMDNSRFKAGAIESQVVARQTGSVISQALNPRMIQQGGFALQDFFSVLNQGGANAAARAFGGITNNLAMLGAGFGPVGMAVTSIGAGLATVLIPMLMKGEEETKKFADALERLSYESDQQVAAMQRQADMAQKLKDITREQEFTGKREQNADKQIRSTEEEIASIEKQIQVRNAQFRQSMNLANLESQQFGEDKPAVIKQGRGDAFVEGRLSESARFSVSDKYFESFTKQRNAIVELYQKERELKEFRQQLQVVEPKARAMDQEEDIRKLEKETFDENIRSRNQINQQSQSAHDKAKERIREINMLYREGFLLKNEAEKAIFETVKSLPTQRGSQEALLSGSAGAISQINKAQAGNDIWQQQVKLAQGLLDEAKQQTQVLKEISRDGHMEPVTIGQ